MFEQFFDNIKDAVKFRYHYGGVIYQYREVDQEEINRIEKEIEKDDNKAREECKSGNYLTTEQYLEEIRNTQNKG